MTKTDNRLLSGEMLTSLNKSTLCVNDKEWFDKIHNEHVTYSLCKTHSYVSKKHGSRTRIKSVAAFTLKSEEERSKVSELLNSYGITHTLSTPKSKNIKKISTPPKYIYINGMQSIYKLIQLSEEKDNIKMNIMKEYIINHDKPELFDDYLSNFKSYSKKRG